ncbi:MAG: hypothetical protein MJZ16_06345 [Bacteroidales bacterium]|nr:hypothetical protein [Bacteroidales bacterium]
MAKKSKDPFEVFKQATLGSNSSLSSALSSKPKEEVKEDVKKDDSPTPSAPEVTAPQPSVQNTTEEKEVKKVSKNANRELVSFHISKETKKQLDYLKVEVGKSLNDFYIEAIEDLLVKYKKNS